MTQRETPPNMDTVCRVKYCRIRTANRPCIPVYGLRDRIREYTGDLQSIFGSILRYAYSPDTDCVLPYKAIASFYLFVIYSQ